MTYFKNNEEEQQNETPMWEKSIEELKLIIENFENELLAHTENIPNSQVGREKAARDGKLPDCGMYWLKDRGVATWYLKMGWLSTWPGKESHPRSWKLTTKYISDGIPEKESALEELRQRREYAKEQQFKLDADLINSPA